MSIRFTFPGGENINRACRTLVDSANLHGVSVSGVFNNIELVATPGASAAALQNFYTREMGSRHDDWSDSAEGREFESRVSENKAWANAVGVLPFSIRDANAWNAHLAANDDRLGQMLTRFIARWAHLMEREIAAGRSVLDVADRCSHLADLEIMSGFATRIATSILCQVWTHGDELRHWVKTRTT